MTPRLTRTLLIAAATLSLLAPRHTAAQRPAPLIAAAPVVEREVAAAQTFVATVRPTRMVTIGSAASGRVFKYDLEEGDRVEEMQPIAELLTETISSEIKAAEADLKLRQSELQELVNGTRPEELDQARARMQAAEARLEYAATHRDRVEQLFRQGGSSVAERDEAVTLYTAAVNEFAEAKSAYDLAELGPRKEKIAQAEAAAEMQAAVVEKLTDQKRKHTVIARFNGFIIKKLTEVGAWVNTGDPVAEVAELDSVDVEAFVTEKQVPNIFVGMKVDVEIPALGAELFEGVVQQIIPQGDARTRTFPVQVRVKNEIVDGMPRIKAGMLARAKLPIGPLQTAKLVPKDALVFRGENTSLLAITPDENDPKKGTVRPVPVELGVSQGQQIQVTGGVEVGELVVVEGNERLRPGQTVVIDAVRNVDSEAATKSAKR